MQSLTTTHSAGEPDLFPTSAATKRSRVKSLGSRLFLAVWAAALLLVGASLMTGHWIVLPKPGTEDAKLMAAMHQFAEGNEGHWVLTHVLYADCRCSRRIFDYVIDRPLPSGAKERVLLVGAQEEFVNAATKRGIEVTPVTREMLVSEFNITSAPLLLISDPKGAIVYAGGYTARKQGPDYRDLQLLFAARSGRPVDEYPVYGCGVSNELQQVLDPLGIK